jgi:hypothetical protein
MQVGGQIRTPSGTQPSGTSARACKEDTCVYLKVNMTRELIMPGLGPEPVLQTDPLLPSERVCNCRRLYTVELSPVQRNASTEFPSSMKSLTYKSIPHLECSFSTNLFHDLCHILPIESRNCHPGLAYLPLTHTHTAFLSPGTKDAKSLFCVPGLSSSISMTSPLPLSLLLSIYLSLQDLFQSSMDMPDNLPS